MKRFLSLLASILVCASAHADSCATGLQPLFTSFQAVKLCSYFSAGTIGTIANNTFTTARNAANGANLSIWKADSSDNTVLNAGTGKVVNFDIAVTPVVGVNSLGFTSTASTLVVTAPTAISLSAGAATTPVVKVQSNGLAFQAAGEGLTFTPYTITPAATPVAGTNDIKLGSVNVFPTAAANAAACLPVPVGGESLKGFNSNAANTIRVKACGTPGVNGGAAGTYIGVVAQAKFDCEASSASNWNCSTSSAVAAPAGP